MSSSVTLIVNHLELHELRQSLGATNVLTAIDASNPDKFYDVGQIAATIQITAPAIAALAAWLWSQRKDARIVEETLKEKRADGSTIEHRIKYKANDPKKAISELIALLNSFFPRASE